MGPVSLLDPRSDRIRVAECSGVFRDPFPAILRAYPDFDPSPWGREIRAVYYEGDKRFTNPPRRGTGRNTMKEPADFSHFLALDMRVGRVVGVEDADTRKPLYRVTVDFGPEIGTRVSIAGYADYAKDDLMGKFVVAVINFPPKKMGPETSELFILGATNADGKAVYVTTESEVPLGTVVL